MKLERLSENQIRCTLNKHDLLDRELKLSELAYGTEKAKELFRDMMAQASDELGFEADDIPLIIEAIPISGDCVILIVTKVEDPEELDTRFARFSPSYTDPDADTDDDDFYDTDDEYAEHEEYTGADEILDLFKQLRHDILSNLESHSQEKTDAAQPASADPVTKPDSSDASGSVHISRTFSFNSLDDISAMACALRGNVPEASRLYKHPKTGLYYLYMDKGTLSPEDFNKVCNIATEYGSREKNTYGTKAYFDEHYDIIIKHNALNILSQI